MRSRRLAEVFACTHAATGYVTQARAHSGPVQDVPCGIKVSVDRQSAMRTLMLPITELLGHSCATAGTILTRVTGIHLDQAGTSLCSFIPQERDEPGPRSVVDILCKAATREPLHLESLDRDHVVVAYEASARLMEVVGATTNRCLMAPSHCNARFTPGPGASFLPR